MNKAFVTGITGQDGAYLAGLLLGKGYEVHGLQRRASSFNTARIDHLIAGEDGAGKNLHLHYGDLTDSSNIIRLIKEIEPDEIYNLAAQSHVHVSFETPEYTANADALGTLRILEAIKTLEFVDKTRFYQASTSELYGKAQEIPQKETTPFYPRSPYAAAKLYAYWITVNYREGYGMFACNGILFNHESPVRGETFVTRKITMAAARIRCGLQRKLLVGNLDAKRDWGHAKDYVEGMWLMLQQDKPDDYILGTGETRTVREFAGKAFAELGVELDWQGTGIDERGIVRTVKPVSASGLNLPSGVAPGDVVVTVDPGLFRPTEVDELIGDATKAREKLGWKCEYSFEDLVSEMVESDLALVMRDA